ncbi:diguanylate cyclase [Ningiella sp. W23]|uniref:diguanylate cyclase n=1 Tax=Ningiella sp. W23 TaxID=3023715 RepID=UPI00375655D3
MIYEKASSARLLIANNFILRYFNSSFAPVSTLATMLVVALCLCFSAFANSQDSQDSQLNQGLVLKPAPLLNEDYERKLQRMLAKPAEFLDDESSASEQEGEFVTMQHYYLTAQAQLLSGEPEQALRALQNGLSLAENSSLSSKRALNALFFEGMASIYLQLSDLPNARQAITEAINNTALPDSQPVLIQRLEMRALIDLQAGASISALQDLQLALQLASTLELNAQEIKLATEISKVHQQRNEHAIALSYVQQALDKAQTTNNEKTLLDVLITSMPSLLASRQLPLASERLERINALLLKHSNLQLSAKALYYAGELAYNQGDVQEAIDKLTSAQQLFDEQTLEQAQTQLLLSRSYTVLNDMDKAIKHLVDAFDAVQGNMSDFNLVQSIQLHRAELLARLNQFEEAFKVTRDVIAARDINQPIDEVRRMLDMHTNFQLQMQKQENIELKQKNEFQSFEIENKQMLNRLFFLVIALLICISALLLLMFIRSRRHRQKLEQIAHSDALTGVFSRRRILEILDFQHDMFKRNLLPYCVAIIDLDYFKQINDRHGHQKGDEVLKAAGAIAQQSFRKTDSIGRIGGEEFLFIFPDTHIEQAKPLLEKYCKALSKVSTELKIKQDTSASVGLVQATEDEIASNIISRADKAMYKAKNNGRNQIVTA